MDSALQIWNLQKVADILDEYISLCALIKVESNSFHSYCFGAVYF